MRGVVSLLVLVALVGCASARPVLYPNERLERVGDEGFERDLEECLVLAEEAEAGGSGAERSGEIAAETTGRAGAGAAAGAVGGAIRGSNVGIAAAVGAATAATWGLVRGGFRWMFGANDPDEIERRFVTRCLEKRGYEVVGWR